MKHPCQWIDSELEDWLDEIGMASQDACLELFVMPRRLLDLVTAKVQEIGRLDYAVFIPPGVAVEIVVMSGFIASRCRIEREQSFPKLIGSYMRTTTKGQA